MRKEFETALKDYLCSADSYAVGIREDFKAGWQAAYASRDAEVEFLTKAVHLAHDDSEYFRKENEEIKYALLRNGFVQCDIAACNCGSWHARYGLPERMNEIKELLEDSGHPLCNENGNLVSRALIELIADRDSCKSTDVKFSNLQFELAAYKAANLDLEKEVRNRVEKYNACEVEGYVFVPVEPSPEMLNAAYYVSHDGCKTEGEMITRSYKAMLEAAKGEVK